MSSVDPDFLQAYFTRMRTALGGSSDLFGQLAACKSVILAAAQQGRKTILVGNGGSAAMASHVAVDLTKAAGVRAVVFNEPDLITCLANDYGFERWMEKAIEFYGDPGDVLIAISSSGRSKNILNAVEAARRKGFSKVITLSGFHADNPLRASGDLSLWVDSKAYNHVEMAHHIWLVAIADLIIGKMEYPA